MIAILKKNLRAVMHSAATATVAESARPFVSPIATLQVLVVDDHPTFCKGISALVGRLKHFHVCGEANTAATALDLFRELKPDVVLLDVTLPDGDGIELTKIFLQEHPAVQVLMLSMHDDPGVVSRALRAGAGGYVLKNNEIKELVDALHDLRNGKKHLSATLRGKPLISYLGQSEQLPPVLDNLSRRERETFLAYGEGLRRSEVAKRFGLGVKSVDTYRTLAMRKLNLTSSEDLLRLARECWQIEQRELSGDRDEGCGRDSNLQRGGPTRLARRREKALPR